jgi:hypothetical protein
MKVHYDPKCEELARHFLADTGEDQDEAQVSELAGKIQQTIEEYLGD